MIRLGLLDPPEMVPYASSRATTKPGKPAEHKAIARQVAHESVVLLKNASNVLPLDKASRSSPSPSSARWRMRCCSTGTAARRRYTITPLEGIRNKVGAGVTVNYAAETSDGARR